MTQKDERPGEVNTEAPFPERNDLRDQSTGFDLDCKEWVMGRQRLVLPDETQEENFASMTPYARLLHVFMRCHADKIGRLVENPFFFKNQIFPADDNVTTKTVPDLLEELAKNQHINRYSVNGKKYIQIVAWRQVPHHRELDSVIPNPDGTLYVGVGESPGLAQVLTTASPGSAQVQPRSSLLDPDPDPDPDLSSSFTAREAPETKNPEPEDVDLQTEIQTTIQTFNRKVSQQTEKEINVFRKHLPKRLKGVKPNEQASELKRRVEFLFSEHAPADVFKDKEGRTISFDVGRLVIDWIWDKLGKGLPKYSGPPRPSARAPDQPTGFKGGQRFFGKGGTS